MAYNRGPYDGGTTTGEPESGTLYCANHPTVPTVLRCARCEKPICSRCRVHTPVGYRCLQCANLSVLPTYAMDSTSLTKSVLVGFAFATVLGLVWALLPGYDFWAALILGIGMGEVVSGAANQKRGPALQAVGLAAAIWGIFLSRAALAFFLTVPPLLNFIITFPGNNASSLLRGGAALVGLISRGDYGGILLNLVNRTDLLGLVFVLMALGLTFIRLR
ncbi:MAG TPA: hypothetical protein VFM49_21325 [Chloroflexia bacterium]|nr:hypothetical protein [Chloroflexia bacterium]